MLSEQIRALNADRNRLVGPIALLESSVDDMTGAIKRQAAATAAALGARTVSPQPQPATTPSTAPAAAVAAPEAKTDSIITSSVPLPPGRAAAAQASAGPEPAASSNELGLDLGAASTLDDVEQRWTTVKANFGPLLSNLHPAGSARAPPG